MEEVKTVDMERAYKEFCRKVLIKEDANVVYKDIDETSPGHIMFLVVEKTDPKHNIFKVCRGIYKPSIDYVSGDFIHLTGLEIAQLHSICKHK